MKIALIYLNNERNVGWGAGYIAGALLDAGHEVSFYDTLYSNSEQIVQGIIEKDPEVLMVSSMTLMFPEALELIRSIKARKNLPTLVGGVHSMLMGSKLLEDHPEIDYLCVGEGESMVVEFIRNFPSRSSADSPFYSIENLAYRAPSGEVRMNPLRPAEDLAKLPRFPWHLFPADSIVQQPAGMIYVNSSRGCPFNCSYCCNRVYLKAYKKGYLRSRPIETVLEELHYLKKTYSPKLFYFGDEMFLTDPDHAFKLTTAVATEIKIPYGFMARVEYITPEVVKNLKETGCRYVAMGVECGDEEFRKKHLYRSMTNEKIKYAFDLLREAGIFTASFNMIGYPFDFDSRLTEATIRLNDEIRPAYVQVSVFFPFPGSKLYQKCIDEELIDPDKAGRTKHYFGDSVLKGISLKKKLSKINLHFKPYPFDYAFETFYDPAKATFKRKTVARLKQWAAQHPTAKALKQAVPTPVKSILKSVAAR